MKYLWRFLSFVFGFLPEAAKSVSEIQHAKMKTSLYQLSDDEVDFIHAEAEKNLQNTREIADKLTERARYFLSISFASVAAIVSFFEINFKTAMSGEGNLEELMLLISLGFMLLAMIQFFKSLRLHKLGHTGAGPNNLAPEWLSEPPFAKRKLATMKFAQYRTYEGLIQMNLREIHRKSFYIQRGQLFLFISLLLFVSQYLEAAHKHLPL